MIIIMIKLFSSYCFFIVCSIYLETLKMANLEWKHIIPKLVKYHQISLFFTSTKREIKKNIALFAHNARNK